MDKRIKIKVEHVSKIFKLGKNKEVHALDDISLNIYENEFLAIVGPSGCGKSTLLFIIAGVENTTNGFVYCDDKKIIGPSIGRGVVFQSDAVFPWLTVRQNIEYGPEIRSIPNNEVKEIADTYLKMVGLEKFENLWPKQLSGGMRKRVDLARALANDPDVLLMDEPFGSLDVITKQILQVEIGSLLTNFKKTIFFVTHDLEEAIFLADRIVIMSESPGKIKTVVEVKFGRPRPPQIKVSTKFQKIRAELGSYIETRSIKE